MTSLNLSGQEVSI